jgi:hypothetical protein
MTNINKHNYEAYLLDFMEGRLSKSDAEALESFLRKNPRIDADIFDASALNLNPDKGVTFNKKLDLQRDESIPEISKRDSLLIGMAEGDLNAADKQKAEKLLSEDESALADYALYKKARLQADDSVRYEGKSALKKKAPLISLKQLTYVSAAAVLAGLLAFALIQLNTSVNPKYEPKQISKAGDIIHFDAEKTREQETKINSAIHKPDNNEHLAANTRSVGRQESSSNETSRIEKTEIDRIPRMGVQELPYHEQRMSDVTMSYRETSKPASPMNFNNITYVKVNKDKQGIHLPDRKEIDETLEKYNPIKNLREAKNELLATNAKTLFPVFRIGHPF